MSSINAIKPSMTEKPVDFKSALNKDRRFWEYADGNRNPFTAANTFWRLIGGWEYDAEDLCNFHAMAKCGKEAAYILQRTRRVVNELKRCNYSLALILYRENEATRNRHQNGARVLAVILNYSAANGYCSAAQVSIGNAIGLSRRAVNGWLKVLADAGLIKCVSYDARGTFWWQGRQYTRWTLVWEVVNAAPRLVKRGGLHYPKQAVKGSGRGGSKFSDFQQGSASGQAGDGDAGDGDQPATAHSPGERLVMARLFKAARESLLIKPGSQRRAYLRERMRRLGDPEQKP